MGGHLRGAFACLLGLPMDRVLLSGATTHTTTSGGGDVSTSSLETVFDSASDVNTIPSCQCQSVGSSHEGHSGMRRLRGRIAAAISTLTSASSSSASGAAYLVRRFNENDDDGGDGDVVTSASALGPGLVLQYGAGHAAVARALLRYRALLLSSSADGAASSSVAVRRLQSSGGNSTTNTTSTDASVDVQIVIPADMGSGDGSTGSIIQQQQDAGAAIVGQLDNATASSGNGTSSAFMDSLSASGFLDSYTNNTGLNTDQLQSGMTFSEPIVEVPSQTPTASSQATASSTMTSSPTASITPSASVSASPYDPLWIALQSPKWAGYTYSAVSTSEVITVGGASTCVNVTLFSTATARLSSNGSEITPVSIGAYSDLVYGPSDDCDGGRRAVLRFSGGDACDTGGRSGQVYLYCTYDAQYASSGGVLDSSVTQTNDGDGCTTRLRLFLSCSGTALQSLLCPAGAVASGTRTASPAATPTPSPGSEASTGATPPSCAAVPVDGTSDVTGPSLLWKAPFTSHPATLVGSGRSDLTGRELYRWTITSNSTTAASDPLGPPALSVSAAASIVSDIRSGPWSSNPRNFRVVDVNVTSEGNAMAFAPGGLVFFYTGQPAQQKLYVSDGTLDGTCAVTFAVSGGGALPAGVSLTLTSVVGHELVFSSSSASASNAFFGASSNPFPGSTFVASVTSLANGSSPLCPAALTVANASALYSYAGDILNPMRCGGRTYFAAREASGANHTLRLWRTLSGESLLGGFSQVSSLELSDAPGSVTCVRGHTIIASARLAGALGAPFTLFAVQSDGSASVFGSGPDAGSYSDARWVTAVNGYGLCWSATASAYPTGPVLMCAAVDGTLSADGPAAQAQQLAQVTLSIVSPDDVQLYNSQRLSSLLAVHRKLFFQCRQPNIAGPYYACAYDLASPQAPPVRYDCAPPTAHYSNFAPVFPPSAEEGDGTGTPPPAVVVFPVKTTAAGQPALYALPAALTPAGKSR